MTRCSCSVFYVFLCQSITIPKVIFVGVKEKVVPMHTIKGYEEVEVLLHLLWNCTRCRLSAKVHTPAALQWQEVPTVNAH